jgi:hypothetical protein
MRGARFRGCLGSIFRWGFRLGVLLLLITTLVFCVLFRHPLYNRFSVYPEQEAQWQDLRSRVKPPKTDDGWNDYRGVLHSHSHFSHDSEIPFEEVLAAAKKARLDFLFMSDHCDEGRADFSRQWRGEHEGVVFFPGFEMSHGFLAWGLPPETVLDCTQEPEVLAQEIAGKGGLLFFAHSEEERLWDLPQVNGMEIYNIHTDVLDEKPLDLLPDLLLNGHAYPTQTFRGIFDLQSSILARWDDINRTRKFVGISANDAHQNVGVRATYGALDTLQLFSTSGEPLNAWRLNFLTRPVVRLLFGPLEQGRELFRVDMDPYERTLRYVNTHVLAKEKSEAALFDAVRTGRAYIGFDLIADSSGFVFMATDRSSGAQAVMGETLPWSKQVRLTASSPLPCLFQIWHDGTKIYDTPGEELNFAPPAPGKYRVVASLRAGGEPIPWVYTNPIELTP